MSGLSPVFKDYAEGAPSVQRKETVESEGVLQSDRGRRGPKRIEKNEKKESAAKASKPSDTCLMCNHQLTPTLYRLTRDPMGLMFDCIKIIGNLSLTNK